MEKLLISKIKEEIVYLWYMAKIHKDTIKAELSYFKKDSQNENLKVLRENLNKVNKLIDNLNIIYKKLKSKNLDFNIDDFNKIVENCKAIEFDIKKKLDKIDINICNEVLVQDNFRRKIFKKPTLHLIYVIKDNIIEIDESNINQFAKNHIIEYLGDKLNTFLNLEVNLSRKNNENLQDIIK